jgi:hypothetical protein
LAFLSVAAAAAAAAAISDSSTILKVKKPIGNGSAQGKAHESQDNDPFFLDWLNMKETIFH